MALKQNILTYLIIAFTLFALLNSIPAYSIKNENNLFIVVSFPNLINDIKQLIREGDRVVSIAPQGTDPHEYSLTPKNINDLEKADLIVTLAHAPFERKIHSLYIEGKIKGVLIEIPYIPGIIVRENPATHKPNYHMVIYDPFNYIIFIKHIAYKLGELNPSHMEYYLERMKKVIENITSIIAETPQVSKIAVADTPVTVYAVEWMGINVKYLLIKEHDVQITPQDILNIENAMRNKTIQIAIVTSPAVSPASRKLLELAEKYSIPVLYVPSPLAPEPITSKLTRLSREVAGLLENNLYSETDNYESYKGLEEPIITSSTYYYETALLMLGASIFLLTIYKILRRRT